MDTIKIIIKRLENHISLTDTEDNQLLNYITNGQEKIDEAIEYGNNCLENLKDQESYMCESIDVVSLLKMIHKNYIEILKGDDK